MKRHSISLLVIVNLALVMLLAWLWLDRQGPRNVRWTAPAAAKPNFSDMLPPLARPGSDVATQFPEILEKPLFSPSRRPPSVVMAASASPPPDPLANVVLQGVFRTPAGGGIIVRVDGKTRRAQLGEKIGPWTIRRVGEEDVTLAQGSESRVIRLARLAVGARVPSVSLKGVQTPDPKLQMSGAQTVQESERERLRYLNEMNERNGLPPITTR